jgi:hypothetical protein
MILSTSLILKYTRLCRRKKGSPFFIHSVKVTNDTPNFSDSSCLDNSRSSCGGLPPILKCSCNSALTASLIHRLRASWLIISMPQMKIKKQRRRDHADLRG